jgi:hypothetical protein
MDIVSIGKYQPCKTHQIVEFVERFLESKEAEDTGEDVVALLSDLVVANRSTESTDNTKKQKTSNSKRTKQEDTSETDVDKPKKRQKASKT